jgi:hypothetical protein
VRRVAFALLLAGCGAAPAKAPVPDALADVSIPALPDWTDPYAGSDPGDARFFRIEALMQRYELSRMDAVELQNRYRDLTRAAPEGDRAAQFAQALAAVKRGERESRLDPSALEKAPFIIVFDLDDTLYDQYHTPEGCADATFDAGGKPRRIRFTPGWDAAIRRIRALGGAVVVFSANRDDTTWANLEHMPLDGQPLATSPDIAGVLTNSYLVLQEKADGPPVVVPSKDLRIVDPDLQRVVIVDDNPTRLFQPRNVRIIKKFRGEDACRATDPARRRAYEEALPTVVHEIEDAAAFAQREHVPFAQAFLPYSALGRPAVAALRDAGVAEGDAVEYVRRHPDVADAGW